MQKIIPSKLRASDLVRVITPSRSLSIIREDLRSIADERFRELGLQLSFGEHVVECDDFDSSSVESRLQDLHEAFENKDVKAVITVIGGYNSNQLLTGIDWDLIRSNPKVFCGYSDISVLNNAIFAKSGLVTYSGPHYSTFSQKLHFDYTLEYFRKCLMSAEPYRVFASEHWSDDRWHKDQETRNLIPNSGFVCINEGEARGTILGGNLCSFNLLQGTEYFPALENAVLFLEDDDETRPPNFDRDLLSLIHQPSFRGVKGVVIGRFQKKSNMTSELLDQIVRTKKELDRIPVVAEVDFGHTDPKITFPIGGEVTITATRDRVTIEMIEH